MLIAQPRWLCILLLAAILCCCAWSPHETAAQEMSAEPGIRETAQEILAEPEFRYFEHLGDSPARPESRAGRRQVGFSSGSGSGSSGSGGAGGSGSGSGRQSNGRTKDRSTNTSSNDASSDSSTTIPLGGGLGAVGGVFGLLFHGLAYLILFAVCVLIIVLVIKAIFSQESSPSALTSPAINFDVSVDEDHSPGELPADVYLQKARELAGQRRYREAIAYLLLGGMSAIERAQLIRHRRGLTLRDYLRTLRGKSPQYAGFQTMIGLYEPVGFGRRVASHQTFEEALQGYEHTIQPLK